jgi:hypothetical protein
VGERERERGIHKTGEKKDATYFLGDIKSGNLKG